MRSKDVIQAQIDALERELAEHAVPTWPRSIVYYVHSDKDSNHDIAKKLGLHTEAEQVFRYCLLELQLTLRVEQSGRAVITHVDGVELAAPVKAA